MKLVVIGVAIKRCGEDVLILTQKRLVQNKSYDPLYDNTWEAMGETVKNDESVFDALVRGFKEECGNPDFLPVRIFGKSDIPFWTTGKGDAVLSCEPFSFVQSLGPRQPWVGPVFVVEMDSSFEPATAMNDGEAGEPRWWNARELSEAIEMNPDGFHGAAHAST